MLSVPGDLVLRLEIVSLEGLKNEARVEVSTA